MLYVLPKPDFFSRGRRGRVTHAIGVASGLARNGVRVVVLSGPGTGRYAADFGAGVCVEELSRSGRFGWSAALCGRIQTVLQDDSTLRHVIIRYAVGNAVRFRSLMRGFRDRCWTFEVNTLAYHQYALLPRVLRRMTLRWEQHVLRGADALYAVSDGLARDLLHGQATRGSPPVFVAPNAGNADLAQLALAADQEGRSARGSGRFVYLGSFHAYYDFELVLRAYEHVVTERPWAELHFYGDGERLKSVQAMADGIPNVYFHGRYDPVDLIQRGEVGTDWIFLLPYRQGSMASVGSPTKTFEYMALGRPMIASKVGQLRDLLEDGVTALVHDPARADDLATQMRRLLDDDELRARIGAAARQEFLRRHTWSTRMGELWRQLCELR